MTDENETLSLLLVEDNAGDRRLLEELLKEGELSADLRWEEALAPGLSALEESPPEVLVLDLGLPDSDGVEAVRRCAEAAPTVPIVVLTGQAGMEVALEAQEAGADQYLRKDELTPALLARTLRWAVERRRMQRRTLRWAVERRRMQRRAQRKDDWIEAITENISGGVFRVVEGEGLQHVNDGFLNLLGYRDVGDVRGKDLSSFIAGEETAADLETALGAGRQVGPTEVRFRRADGSTFVGALSARVADPGPNGQPEGPRCSERPRRYDGIVTDTTAQSADRRRRLRVLSAALEQSRNAVLITEAEPLAEPGPKVTYVNEAFEQMTGYAEEEILGKTPRVLQGPETDPEVISSLRAALEAGNPWEGETTNYRKDGTPYVVKWSVSPVRGDGGDIECWVSIQRDVTEERAREEALEERENRLRALANSVPGGIFQFEVLPGGEQEFTFVSEQAGDLLGISSKPEGYFDRFVRRVPPSHREELLESIEEAVQAGREWSYEMPFDRPDGERIWVRGISTPERRETAEGEKLVYHGVTIDVTDRREAERRYEAIFNQTYQFTGLMEPDGTLIEANDSALEVGGLKEEDVLGKPIWETYWFQTGEEARGRLREAVQRAAEGEFVRYEETVQSVEGPLVIDFSIRPMMGEDGAVRLLIPEGRDITERKRREEEAERRAQAMKVASDGMAILDSEGTYTFVNEAHAQIYGYDDPEALMGENWRLCYGEEELARFEEEVMPALEAEGTWQGEAVGQRADGSLFDQSLTLTMLEGGGIICVVRNITDRKERERELRKAKEAAEEASRLKSTLLANMSHEFRTPLTSILGFADAIRGQAAAVETEGLSEVAASAIESAERFASLIRKGGERLQDTLTSVLKLSKLEAEDTDLELESCNLTEAAEDAADSASAQAEEAGLTFEIQYPEEPVWARAHADGLTAALEKIVGNAIKFTDPGGSVVVRVREEAGDTAEGPGETNRGAAVIEIEDSGIGMDPDEVERLFEAFEQESEGLSREYEGSGLGLSVAHRLIEKMGGTIDVSTEKGEGSRFTIYLPKEKPPGF